eukprot:CAMPEP_0197025274 /NCGR_PEP_ID=MMETSP1384-20130603/5663_1 /TAXON_ID=29189 /ORGANISM="Ammonia sp." /LENGTH=558 /DNA_ID=CAMNT_0042453791 /DNA_START=30 /DNA_END=1706 /DNA_ORIENTATION=-
MSTYGKCVQQLLQRGLPSVAPKRRKPTLKPMLAICERMKNPQNSYKCIHVTGTNGKGSVSTKLAASLSHCGYRVGLFTSPHISSVRERICVNGKMITKLDFVNDFNKVLYYESEIEYELTFFELLNAMAFYHFKRVGVDFAIIEVGVGGTWDSTNVLQHTLLSVIVSISLDHTKLLGNSVDSIAKDKCGIIKPGRPVVIGPSVPYKIARPIADSMHSDLYQMNDDNYDSFDEHNTNLARFALQILNKKYFILPKHIEQLSAPLTVRPHCRMQLVHVHLYKLFKMLLSPHNHRKASNASPRAAAAVSSSNVKVSAASARSSRSVSGSVLSSFQRKWLKKYISTEIEYEKYKQCNTPIVCILDVAHNPEAFKQLFRSLHKQYSPLQYSYRVVLGLNPHKKLKSCCQVVAEYADSVHLVSSNEAEFAIDVKRVHGILTEKCGVDENKVFMTGNGNMFMEIVYALNECWLHNNSKQELNSMALYSSQSEQSGDTDPKQNASNDSGNAAVSKSEKKSNEGDKGKQSYKTEILIITGSFHIMTDARRTLGLKHDDDADDLKQLV